MSNTATSDPESARKKGPWANRVVGTEVVHTPEYDEFMKDLAEYHQKRGWVYYLFRVDSYGGRADSWLLTYRYVVPSIFSLA